MRSKLSLSLLVTMMLPLISTETPQLHNPRSEADASNTVTVPQQRQPHTLLAIFAHPDDETSAAPVLAHYARQGAKVYLAIATEGEKGATPQSGMETGNRLAEVRRSEAECACRELGLQSPIFFGLNDGELGAITGPPGQNVQSLVDDIGELIVKVHPDVIVTWGPEGGDGHPDHRLVSDAVTEVIQSHSRSPKLVYVGITGRQAALLNSFSRIRWRSVDSAYLTVSIPFDSRDTLAWHRALECHKSQFAPQAVAKLETALDQAWNGEESFRPWFGNRSSKDLFK